MVKENLSRWKNDNKNHHKEAFVKKLNKFFVATTSIQHLYGRNAELIKIEKTLSLDGRQVFRYGDRN